MSTNEFKETPACADKNTAFPTEDVCPKCGADIEIWSDEDETTCRSCDYVIRNS